MCLVVLNGVKSIDFICKKEKTPEEIGESYGEPGRIAEGRRRTPDGIKGIDFICIGREKDDDDAIQIIKKN